MSVSSLTHDYAFLCQCTVEEGVICAELLLVNQGFEPGEYELWDQDNNRYAVIIPAQPRQVNRDVRLECVVTPAL